MTGAVWVESCSASLLTAFEPSSHQAFKPPSLQAFEPSSLREPKILNAYSSQRLSVQLK